MFFHRQAAFPPWLVPARLSGAAVVLSNRDRTGWGRSPAQTPIHIPFITEHLSVMDNILHCHGFLPDLVLYSYKYNFSLCISKFACPLTTSSISFGQFVLATEERGSAASEEPYAEVSIQTLKFDPEKNLPILFIPLVQRVISQDSWMMDVFFITRVYAQYLWFHLPWFILLN